MNKNYMQEVAKMLDVGIGEEFDLLDGNGEIVAYSPYKFTNDRIVDCDDDEMSYSMLWNLLTGEYTLQRHPWKPKDGMMYWFVTPDDSVDFCYFFKDKLNSIAMLNLGNCFPSKEVAEYNAPRMLKKFEEVKKGCRG